MAQMKIISWTNPTPAVARKENIGFTVGQITVYNTQGILGTFSWNNQMVDGTASDDKAGTIIAAPDGFSALNETVNYGATISGFTNAAPGVITVDDTATAGFAAGDTIKVAGLSDNDAGTDPLNGTFTVASVTATAITLVESTVGFSVYVSGGFATRVSDVNGVAIPTENFARLGIIIGTDVVGADGTLMTAVIHGENSVT